MLEYIFGRRHPPIEEVLPEAVVEKFFAFTRDKRTVKTQSPTAQSTTTLWFDFVISVHQLKDDQLPTHLSEMIVQWLKYERFDDNVTDWAIMGLTDALLLLEYYESHRERRGERG
jgi:hypothetical protein